MNKPATPEDNVRICAARIRELLSPAEQRELEEAAVLIEFLRADLIAMQKERDETYSDYLLERKRAALQLEEADKCRVRAEKAEQALADAKAESNLAKESLMTMFDRKEELEQALALRGEPVAWISTCVVDGKEHYGKLPVQSLQAGFYKHTPLYR